MDTVIFAPELIEYAFLAVSLSDTKFMVRRVFKWITQRILLTFALIKLLAFATLFNAQKKPVLNYFALEVAAIIVARRRHRREQRARSRKERIFPHVFIWKEHIIWTYCLPSHVIFYLLQEIKDDLEPPTRSHTIPTPSKPLNFLAFGSFQHTVAYLFASMLICAVLSIYYVGRCVNEMLCQCSLICVLFVNHPQKFPHPSAQFWNCALVLICPI